jgi:hypothetical protein
MTAGRLASCIAIGAAAHRDDPADSMIMNARRAVFTQPGLSALM